MLFLGKRLLHAGLILLGVTLICYLLLFMLPADPARQIAGRSATPEVVENIRHQLGLDLPFYQQYWRYLQGLLHGDLGRSFIQRSEVSELVSARIGPSLQLMAAGILCELVLGIALGTLAALKRGGLADRLLMALSFIGVSAPQFIAAMLFLYLFAVVLNWFPMGGYGGFSHLALPALTLGLLGSGWYSRMLRSSMIEVLHQDFIRTARGSADEFLDLQGLIYAFIRGPDPGRRTLLPVRKESLRCRHGAGISFHKTAGPLGSDL